LTLCSIAFDSVFEPVPVALFALNHQPRRKRGMMNSMEKPSLPVSADIMLELLQYLERSECALELSAAVDDAISEWMARRSEEAERPTHAVLDGYRWKCLFLPAGTLLKVWASAEGEYAKVVGDQLVYAGRPVSPNQFIALCAGSVRNAWTGLDVLMPGEKGWKRASSRRREMELAAKRERERESEVERKRECERVAAEAKTSDPEAPSKPADRARQPPPPGKPAKFDLSGNAGRFESSRSPSAAGCPPSASSAPYASSAPSASYPPSAGHPPAAGQQWTGEDAFADEISFDHMGVRIGRRQNVPDRRDPRALVDRRD
jgi:hypothetical protein